MWNDNGEICELSGLLKVKNAVSFFTKTSINRSLDLKYQNDVTAS